MASVSVGVGLCQLADLFQAFECGGKKKFSLTWQTGHQFLTTRSPNLLSHGSRRRVRTKHLIKFLTQRLERTRSASQLIESPLHENTGRVVSGKEKSTEGIACLLEDLRGEDLDVGKTEGHGATSDRLALDFAVELLADEALEHGVELGRLAVDVPVHPPLGVNLGHARGEEGALAFAVGCQDGALLAWALGLEVLVEGDDSYFWGKDEVISFSRIQQCCRSAKSDAVLTDNVKSQVGGEFAEAEFLAGLDVFVQVIKEALRLFQHGRREAEEMLRGEAGNDSLSEILPFITLKSPETILISVAILGLMLTQVRPCKDKTYI